MSDDELIALAEPFVRRVQTYEQTRQRPTIEWIGAHPRLGAMSISPAAVVRYGICVSVGAIIHREFDATLSASIIETAFGLLKGRPVRFLKFEDAAVLDWCWRNSHHGQIALNHACANVAEIASTYSLDPSFDVESVRGSFAVLERNNSIESKPTGAFELVEEVKVFG